MYYTLKRSGILRGKKNFQLLFEQGRKFNGEFVKCLVVSAASLNASKKENVLMGVRVSRAVRRAVERNRIKRLIRESFRLNKNRVTSYNGKFSQPIALLFMFNPKWTDIHCLPTLKEINQDMKIVLSEIAQSEARGLLK